MAALLDQHYDVFAPVFGNGTADLIASKPGQPALRIECKATSEQPLHTREGRYGVRLKRSKHPRAGEKRRTVNFDSASCEVVAVYLIELDVVVFYPSAELHGRGSFTAWDDPLRRTVPVFDYTPPLTVDA